jgi:hypothetical protein
MKKEYIYLALAALAGYYFFFYEKKDEQGASEELPQVGDESRVSSTVDVNTIGDRDAFAANNDKQSFISQVQIKHLA